MGIWPPDFNVKSPASCSPKPNSATGVKQKLSRRHIHCPVPKIAIFRRENFQTRYCRGNAIYSKVRPTPSYLLLLLSDWTKSKRPSPERSCIRLGIHSSLLGATRFDSDTLCLIGRNRNSWHIRDTLWSLT